LVASYPLILANPLYINRFATFSRLFLILLTCAQALISIPRPVEPEILQPYVALPPTNVEQEAIAQTLSDVDALIAALDNLIAKQRHLKTATMQQLLTGKKRLPGFGEGKGYKQTDVGIIPEDWELHPLGEITEYIKGFAFKSSDFQTHGVRVIRVSDTTFDLIKDDNEIFIDERKAQIFRKWSMREGDLIISTVGSKPPMYDSMVGKATFVDVKNKNSLLNQNAVIIRSKDWSREAQIFLHNHLKQPRYIDYIEKIFRGNANQASITLKELFEFLIPMPKDSEEQRAIATVLSDMDAAISALETRRAKTQAIKQGMMQELLTGKTRLINNE
jgi:type I restriction enzyme S subunit